jgi:hypothetical protein
MRSRHFPCVRTITQPWLGVSESVEISFSSQLFIASIWVQSQPIEISNFGAALHLRLWADLSWVTSEGAADRNLRLYNDMISAAQSAK